MIAPLALNPKIKKIIIVVGQESNDLMSKCRRCKKVTFVKNANFAKNLDSGSLQLGMKEISSDSFLWINRPVILKNLRVKDARRTCIFCCDIPKNNLFTGVIENNDKIIGFCKKERLKWLGATYITSVDYKAINDMPDYLLGIEMMSILQPAITKIKETNLKVFI